MPATAKTTRACTWGCGMTDPTPADAEARRLVFAEEYGVHADDIHFLLKAIDDEGAVLIAERLGTKRPSPQPTRTETRTWRPDSWIA